MSKKTNNTEDLLTSLQASLDQAEWSWLAQHAKRDAVVLIAPGIDLVEAGVHIARDNTAVIQDWIAAGKLTKPSREQLDAWNSEPAKRFLSLVVQPYVLVQEILH